MINVILPLLLACRPSCATGLAPVRSIVDDSAGPPLTAVLSHDPRRGIDKLDIYARLKDRSILVYTHPGSADRLEFDASMSADKGFPDLLRDGSRTVAYRAAAPGLGKTLHILRIQRLRARRAGSFPEGELRDVDGDGRMEAVSRELPLGRFLSMGCDDFSTLSQTAFETRVFAWKEGRFADVSSQVHAFFDEEISRLEEKLALIPKEKRPGEYLGAALSVYYDYAAQGRRRQGWERLCSLFQPPSYAVPRVKTCIEQVKSQLRRSLEIPEDWG